MLKMPKNIKKRKTESQLTPLSHTLQLLFSSHLFLSLSAARVSRNFFLFFSVNHNKRRATLYALMTSKRQSLACPEPSSAEPPPSIKTLNVNDSSNANCLYEQAYAAACRAVKHDRLGEFEKAKNEYKRVIEVSKCSTDFWFSRNKKPTQNKYLSFSTNFYKVKMKGLFLILKAQRGDNIYMLQMQ